MMKTVWKSTAEIRHAIGSARRVAILSCDSCAAQCGTGGLAGIEKLQALLKHWGIEVVAAGLVEECCDEGFMQKALRLYARAIAQSDVLIVVSCASGIKSAYLCHAEISLASVLDTLGGGVFTSQENEISRSLCKGCGQCVITYTGGICPVSTCPGKRKYAPCKNHLQQNGRCCLNRNQKCIWGEIAPRADLEALDALRQRQS